MTAELLPVNSNDGFGGLGSGFMGGLIGGALFGGGLGGFGWGNRGGVGVGSAYDAGILTNMSNQISQGAISNQIQHANDAAVAAQMSAIQTNADQNMFVGNLINSTGDAITGAINQGTITGLQNTGALQQSLCGINNNITTQGFESRLNAQQLAAQSQYQHCQLSHAIFEEGCKNRELQREIASNQQATQLADAKAQIAALQAQVNLTNQLQAQTAYLIDRLGTAAARTATSGS